MNFKKHILPISTLIILLLLYNFNQKLIGPSVFIIVGFGFLYAALILRNRNREIKMFGVKTKGKIISFKEEKIKDADGESNVFYFPIIQFKDLSGIVNTQKLDISQTPNKKSEELEIIYLKKGNEYQILLNNNWWEKNLHKIFLISAIIFIGLGILVIYRQI